MTIAVEPFAGAFTADPDHSSFHAAVRHMGVGSFRTSFDDVEARLEPGSDGPRLLGQARVESIGIRSPAEFRAHVVEGAEFFDARNHPHIAFASSWLRFSEDGAVELEGTLAMRGTGRPIAAVGSYRSPVDDPYGLRRGAIDLSATIDRRDWGMDYQMQMPGGGDVLSWQVELTAHLELVTGGG